MPCMCFVIHRVSRTRAQNRIKSGQNTSIRFRVCGLDRLHRTWGYCTSGIGRGQLVFRKSGITPRKLVITHKSLTCHSERPKGSKESRFRTI